MVWAGVAGFLAAMALNCNLYLLTVVGAFGLWPLGHFAMRRDWWALGMTVLMGGAGFVVGYVALVVGRHFLVPSQGWQFDLFALTTGAGLASGGGAVWHEDVVGLIWNDQWVHLLIPVVVLIGVAVFARRSRGTERVGVALAGIVFFVGDGGSVLRDRFRVEGGGDFPGVLLRLRGPGDVSGLGGGRRWAARWAGVAAK